jgi:GAF domain
LRGKNTCQAEQPVRAVRTLFQRKLLLPGTGNTIVGVMAVLQFIPDLPRSGNAGIEVSVHHDAESSLVPEAAPRILNAVITPPRVHPAVLMPLLRFAAELALRSTGASGCAIAMRAGAGFRCYSSVGDAPPVDAPVRLAGTLTGMCVRKGKTIRRDDMAEEETAELIGCAGNTRSILLAPIFQNGNVGGVIGIFAPEPHSFLDEHEAALEHLAGVVGIALLHPDRLAASAEIAESFTDPSIQEAGEAREISIPAPQPVPSGDPDRAAHALETLARVITGAIVNAQRPALPAAEPADAPAPTGQPRKRLYGLPCSKCGAYFTSDQPSCAVCGTARSGKR